MDESDEYIDDEFDESLQHIVKSSINSNNNNAKASQLKGIVRNLEYGMRS